jgi:hypothetical protein
LTWGCHNLLGQVCYCALEKEKEKETKGVWHFGLTIYILKYLKAKK